jgi:hypothetical protein
MQAYAQSLRAAVCGCIIDIKGHDVARRVLAVCKYHLLCWISLDGAVKAALGLTAAIFPESQWDF